VDAALAKSARDEPIFSFSAMQSDTNLSEHANHEAAGLAPQETRGKPRRFMERSRRRHNVSSICDASRAHRIDPEKIRGLVVQ